MTLEHKMYVGLDEIKALVFQCNKCHSRVVIAPEDAEAPPPKCPNGHVWEWNVPAEYQTTAGSSFVFFLLALKKLRDPIMQRAGFSVLLEIEEPKQ